MATINIEGVIGLDVGASDIRAQLEAVDGPVEIIVNSPGGLVSEGTAVYNAIRDYRRNGGKVTARVVGLAASMSSYIPLAAESVSVEDNSVYMIHNPRTIAAGDQREMRKVADTLEGLSGILARAYADKTGSEIEAVREMMNEETYLFGQEIVDAGFADSIEPAGDGTEDRAEAVALAQTNVQHMVSKVKEESNESADEIAAVLGDIEKSAAVSRAEKARPQAGTRTREVPMADQEQKQEHPAEDVKQYDDGVRDGIEQERQRVARLRKAAESDPDNVKLQEVVGAAIQNGEYYSDVTEAIAVAIRDGRKFEGENPPNVETAESDHVSLTEEEKAIADNLGVSYDDMKAQKGGK